MILGIETATSVLGVALAHEGRVLGSRMLERPNVHDELLVPMCRDLIADCGQTMEQLDAVAVSSGPGSFTGLRIGMAAAKGIALALDIPLAAVPTLDAMAFTVLRSFPFPAEKRLCVYLDARREDVYAGVYRLSGAAFETLVPACVLDAAKAALALESGDYLIGDGAEKVRASADIPVFVLPAGTVPDPRSVALLGAELIAGGHAADVAGCEPLYLQEFKVKQAKNALL